MDLHSDCKFVSPCQWFIVHVHCLWGTLEMKSIIWLKFQDLAKSENSSLVKTQSIVHDKSQSGSCITEDGLESSDD